MLNQQGIPDFGSKRVTPKSLNGSPSRINEQDINIRRRLSAKGNEPYGCCCAYRKRFRTVVSPQRRCHSLTSSSATYLILTAAMIRFNAVLPLATILTPYLRNLVFVFFTRVPIAFMYLRRATISSWPGCSFPLFFMFSCVSVRYRGSLERSVWAK